MTDLAQHLAALGWLALALWLAAGLADWLCHRRSHIERTSGPRESALHVLLFLLIAVPLVLGLFLEINALLLAVMAGGVVAHMGCSWWDTAYAQPKRYIAPLEQMIHSHLEMLPLFGLAVAVLLHWDALRAPEWTFALRDTALPRWSVVAVLTGLSLGLGFIFEEWWRGERTRRALIMAPARASPRPPPP